MINGLYVVLSLLCCIVLYPIIQRCISEIIDVITFNKLQNGDLFVHRHNKNEHKYDMYAQHVIVVGKESNSEKKQIVKFRNLNTNKYQILEWHIFRHYYEHAKLTIKNLA